MRVILFDTYALSGCITNTKPKATDLIIKHYTAYGTYQVLEDAEDIFKQLRQLADNHGYQIRILIKTESDVLFSRRFIAQSERCFTKPPVMTLQDALYMQSIGTQNIVIGEQSTVEAAEKNGYLTYAIHEKQPLLLTIRQILNNAFSYEAMPAEFKQAFQRKRKSDLLKYKGQLTGEQFWKTLTYDNKLQLYKEFLTVSQRHCARLSLFSANKPSEWEGFWQYLGKATEKERGSWSQNPIALREYWKSLTEDAKRRYQIAFIKKRQSLISSVNQRVKLVPGMG